MARGCTVHGQGLGQVEEKEFWHPAHPDTRVTAPPTQLESLGSLLCICLGKSLLSVFTLSAYCKEPCMSLLPSAVGEWFENIQL